MKIEDLEKSLHFYFKKILYPEGGKTPGFPGFALLASERRLREEGERGGREGGGVLGLNPTPSRSTRLDPIENFPRDFPINFFPKK